MAAGAEDRFLKRDGPAAEQANTKPRGVFKCWLFYLYRQDNAQPEISAGGIVTRVADGAEDGLESGADRPHSRPTPDHNGVVGVGLFVSARKAGDEKVKQR